MAGVTSLGLAPVLKDGTLTVLTRATSLLVCTVETLRPRLTPLSVLVLCSVG